MKPGDRVSLIPGKSQYLPDGKRVEELKLTVQTNPTENFFNSGFTSLEYPGWSFNKEAFELSYIQEFNDKLEDLIK